MIHEMIEIGQVLMEMIGVSKRFPGTLAVDTVDFSIKAGEVHALMGENGAGKSTLMKILAGSFNDYTGQVKIMGKEVTLYSPSQAKENGIEMIYQELSLAKPLSVAENVMVGHLPQKGLFVDKKELYRQTSEILAKVGLDYIDPSIEISEISQHEAQLVEIGKALSNDPIILVMDEPTSALSTEEVKRLFEIIKDLKAQGIGVVYISHHIPEIFQIADKVTVMRDGKRIDTKNIDEVTPEKLVEMMVGQKIDKFYNKEKSNASEVILKADNISRWGFFHQISFEARKGEILGICGLAGSGRSELARAIIGIDRIDEGELYFEGKKILNKNMNDALKKGIAYLSEDRKLQGLALRMNMEENILAALIPDLSNAGIYSAKKGAPIVNKEMERLNIYPAEPKRMVSNFSGGNQQKVLLGKWVAMAPKVLILDEPTRGVDIGAKQLIHKVVQDLANQGVCIILISSDLPELSGLSDRAIILRSGRIIGELRKDEIDENVLLLAANGEEVLHHESKA